MEEWLIHSNMGIGCTCCKMSIKLCKIATNLCLTFCLSPFRVTCISAAQVLGPLGDFLALLHRCNFGSTLFLYYLCISSQKLNTALQFPILTDQHLICLLVFFWVGGSSFFSLPTSPQDWEILSSFPLSLSYNSFYFLATLFSTNIVQLWWKKSFWKRCHSWTLLFIVNWETHLASLTLTCLHALIFGYQILERCGYFWVYLLM